MTTDFIRRSAAVVVLALAAPLVHAADSYKVNSLLLAPVALATEPPVAASVETSALVTCTAQRLEAFVGPTGIHQTWPTTKELPSGATDEVLLSDTGMVADGYSHTLIVDVPNRTAYVVQQGGIAGFRTIYGPLPVAGCTRLPSTPSRRRV